jgi:hypothetical protein
MKYPLDVILDKIIKKENHKDTGTWKLATDYRGGKLDIRVVGSEKLGNDIWAGDLSYSNGRNRKFYDNFIKDFGNLKITTSQIRDLRYISTIEGYEAVISNLKTLNPDYLIFQMPVQEKAPSGKIIIPQGKNEVFANLMIDVAEFLKEKYR